MSLKWLTDAFAVLENPIVANAVISVFIILIAWVVTLVTRIAFRRSSKIIRERGAQSPSTIQAASTRLDMIRRITNFTIYFLATMLVLLRIPEVRAIGVSLLATAGVIGIVAGLAAQATLGNLIAGISIAFSQPVRLNDAVIYDGDWGWVEEISLMHTVIRTWDNRRLIVPNSVLNTTAIQNWTIRDEWLLAVVMMYVDYTCDMETLKGWAKEIIDSSPYSTEERIVGVQVVDFTEKSMVVRVLGKASDSSNSWNLRCEIREKLIKKFHEAGLPFPEIRLQRIEPGLDLNERGIPS